MRYHFGSIELDTGIMQLLVDGCTVAVEPQVFDLLVFLVENRERVVTKDELFETVWNGRIVSDATLSSRIKDARHALGDDGERQAFIKTLRGRGFQFIGDVKAQEDETGASISLFPKMPVWKRVTAVVSMGLLVILAAITVWPSRSQPTNNTIAVMAFADMSEAKDQEYFADGVAEEILNMLAKTSGLRVVGRTSSFSFKGKDADIQTIGDQLGVSTILEGSVRQDGNRLRITAQLVQTTNGYHLWSESYDRVLTDIFDVQHDIARSVVSSLQKVLIPEKQGLTQEGVGGPLEPEVHRLYLQGRWLLHNRNFERVGRAIDTFKQVIEREPDYAPAYSGLAAAEVLHPAFNRDRGPTDEHDARKRAEVWAQKAFHLDPTLSEPHAALALSYGRQWQWARSRQLLEKALSANPLDTTARMWYGVLLFVTGRVQDGLDQLNIAAAREPVYSTLTRIRAAVLYALGREQEAMETAQLAIALGSPRSHLILSDIARNHGDLDQAVEHYMAFWRTRNTTPEQLEVRRQLYGKLYGSTLNRAKLIQEIEEKVTSGLLRQDQAFSLYLAAGDTVRALKLYAQYGRGSRIFLSTLWRREHHAVRQHPYFSTFVNRIGLLAYWKEFGFPKGCRLLGDDRIACD